MDNQYLKNIKVGMKVTILNTKNKLTSGIIKELAKRNPYHQEGIMVQLENGEIGRVKKIIQNEASHEKNKEDEIREIIRKGENNKMEFKSEAFWSVNYNPAQLKESKSIEVRDYGTRASKVIIAKSIAAFLNSNGGNLIIGVKEDKENHKFEVLGIENDLKKIKDGTIDGFRRTIVDEIIRAFLPSKIFNHLNEYINIEFVKFGERVLCNIIIKRSDSRVFLNISGRELFMIRVESENRTLEGEKLVDYCIKHWGNK